MTEGRTVPPLSGEIMAGAEPKRAAPFDAAGAADGAYETFAASPTAVPRHSAPPPEHPAGIGMLKGPASPPPGRERAGPLFWTAGMTIVLAAFWAAGGHALFAHAPAQRQHAAGIRLATLTTRILPGAAHQIVLVDGELLNEGSRAAPAPALDIAVTGRDGSVTRYVLGTSGEAVAAGGRYAFSSRLDAPKQGADSVLVTVHREGRDP